MPSMPRSYAHGESQPVSMSALEKILKYAICSLWRLVTDQSALTVSATISTLASPESESQANTLVIVSVNDSSRLQDLRNVHIPSNVMMIDLPHFERSLFRFAQTGGPNHSLQQSGSNSPNSPVGSSFGEGGNAGVRPAGLRHYRSKSLNHMQSSSPPRDPSQLLSLRGMLAQLSVPVPHHIPISNSGNAAFYILLVFHMLIDKECVPPAVLTQQQQQQQQPHHQSAPPAAAAGYAMYPMTHMPYPHLQIYPPAVSSPLAAQPHVPSRTGSPSRVHRAPNRQSAPPPGTFRRSTTMYWDEPQQPLGAAAAAAASSAHLGNSATMHHAPPHIERRRSGDLPTSMSRMTLNGGPPVQRERKESGLTRPAGESARRQTSGDRQ